MKLTFFTGVCIGFVAVFLVSCGKDTQEETSKVTIDRASLTLFKPLPAEMTAAHNPITAEKVDLGRKLYYDPILSKDSTISCNSCHNLITFGVDNKPVSTGVADQTGDRNSPTVYNAAGHLAQFWDGRAAHVEEQAKGPILNSVEMAMADSATVITRLKNIAGYVDGFKAAFPDDKEPMTYDNMAKAIGAFERKLVTPSRWDDYLTGNDTALTAVEKAGLKKFMDVGCTTCHNGANMGGSAYFKLGLIKAWPDTSDLGRFKVTQNESDKMTFKVPGLRNVEKTGPYFHDGKIQTLETAVSKMAEHQLGKSLTSEDVQSLVAFLKTLTGRIPEDYIKQPELPR